MTFNVFLILLAVAVLFFLGGLVTGALIWRKHGGDVDRIIGAYKAPVDFTPKPKARP